MNRLITVLVLTLSFMAISSSALWNDMNVWSLDITQEDYQVICKIVSGEAGAEDLIGKMLVAQCILDGCETEKCKPSELRRLYQYSGWKEYYDAEVEEAVTAIFLHGERVTEQRTLYFYNPKLCRSGWHESQSFVIEHGNHRFFG